MGGVSCDLVSSYHRMFKKGVGCRGWSCIMEMWDEERFYHSVLSRQRQSFQDTDSGRKAEMSGHEEAGCWMLERGCPESFLRGHFLSCRHLLPSQEERASVCKWGCSLSGQPHTPPGQRQCQRESRDHTAQEFIENQRWLDYSSYVLGNWGPERERFVRGHRVLELRWGTNQVFWLLFQVLSPLTPISHSYQQVFYAHLFAAFIIR